MRKKNLIPKVSQSNEVLNEVLKDWFKDSSWNQNGANAQMRIRSLHCLLYTITQCGKYKGLSIEEKLMTVAHSIMTLNFMVPGTLLIADHEIYNVDENSRITTLSQIKIGLEEVLEIYLKQHPYENMMVGINPSQLLYMMGSLIKTVFSILYADCVEGYEDYDIVNISLCTALQIL